jgi:hypothetical protein
MKAVRWSPHRKTLINLLGLTEKIPADYQGLFESVSLRQLYLESHRQIIPDIYTDIKVIKSKGGAKHRIFLACTNCAKWIPFGRFSQHYQSKMCRSHV